MAWQALPASTRLRLFAAPSTATVLDLGCGDGWWLRARRRDAPGAALIGIDADPQQLARARALAAADGLRNLRWIEADLCDLPLPMASIDAAHCQAVLCHERDPERMLRSFARVLRPGGVLLSLEPRGPLGRWATRDEPEAAAHDSAALDRWASLDHGPDDNGPPAEERFAAAGFDLVLREALTITLDTASNPDHRLHLDALLERWDRALAEDRTLLDPQQRRTTLAALQRRRRAVACGTSAFHICLHATVAAVAPQVDSANLPRPGA